MGLFNNGMFKHFFGKPTKKDSKAIKSYFSLLSGYTPRYSSYQGALYEIDLVRACIHRIASECAKATPVLVDDEDKNKDFIISKYPNDTMTAYQFYYRLATIFQVENNAYILPQYEEADGSGEIVGLIPVCPHAVEVFEDEQLGMCYLFTFNNGDRKVCPINEVGHIKRMQYKNDLYGDSNDAFDNTAKLVIAQEEGSERAIKSSSLLRFMAKLNTPIDDDEDYQEQQNVFMRNNLEGNESGVLIYDTRFEDVKQIESKPLLVDAEQKKAIENSVFTYWGINEDILQNKYSEDTWNAFYESAIEPFYIQVQEVITKLLYSIEEIKLGKGIRLTADRLQYASNTTKIQVAKEFVDRGLLTLDQGLNILNLPPLPDGQGSVRVIRAEYIDANQVGKEVYENDKNESDSSSSDDISSGSNQSEES